MTVTVEDPVTVTVEHPPPSWSAETWPDTPPWHVVVTVTVESVSVTVGVTVTVGAV
ncbi:MAG: hypothetical protein ABSF00_03270 [Candidatus Bathyarchaeia archaeon]